MTYESHTNHISCVLGRHLQAGCFTPAGGRFYTCRRAVLHLQTGGFIPANRDLIRCGCQRTAILAEVWVWYGF